MIKKIRYHNFASGGPSLQEIVDFFPSMGLHGPEVNWNKIHIFV